MLFEHSSEFSCPVDRLFEYHEQAGAINRLIPPWEPASVVASNDSLQVGSLVSVRNKIGPISQIWKAEHTQYVRNELFVDELKSGPFAKWKHEHRFAPISDSASRLTDRIDFQLHGAPLSNVLKSWVDSKLTAMFRFRHRITADDLKFSELLPTAQHQLRIGVSGSSGLIGRRTIELARVLGIEVVRSTRPQSDQPPSRWPRGVLSAPEDQLEAFENLDAWIHLGGAGIADKRWTNSYKQTIKNTSQGSVSSNPHPRP